MSHVDLACALGTARIVDLTQNLDERTTLWPGSTPFSAPAIGTHERDGGFWRELQVPEHAGTHVDAPAHFVAGGATIDKLAAETFVRPAVVIDVRDTVGDDADALVSAAMIKVAEARDGSIAQGSAALVCTGWDRFVQTPDRYLGSKTTRCPGLSADAARLLVERGVVGVGIDTLSVDVGSSTVFPVHLTTLPAGLWHIEGLVNLAALPARGAWVVVAPLKLTGGSGAPARVFALVPN